MSFFGDLWGGIQDVASDVGGWLGGAAGDIAGQVLGQVLAPAPTGGWGAGPGGLPPIQGPALPPGSGVNAPGYGGAGTINIGGGGLGPLLPPPTQSESAQLAGFGSEVLDYAGGALLDYGASLFEGTPAGNMFGIGGSVNYPSLRGNATLTPMVSSSTRIPRQVQFLMPTPSGGQRLVTYRNIGQPVLYSGDYAAVRRVQRVAKKAKRRAGGR